MQQIFSGVNYHHSKYIAARQSYVVTEIATLKIPEGMRSHSRIENSKFRHVNVWRTMRSSRRSSPAKRLRPMK